MSKRRRLVVLLRGIILFSFVLALFIRIDGPTRFPLFARFFDVAAGFDILFVSFTQYKIARFRRTKNALLAALAMVTACVFAIPYIIQHPFSTVTIICDIFVLPVYAFFVLGSKSL